MTRPPVPFPAPAGYRWMVRPAEEWTAKLSAIGVAPRCRYTVRSESGGRRGHGAPIAAAMRRRFRTSFTWWGYCAEHLYGRWIDGPGVFEGYVVEYVLRPEPKPSSGLTKP